MMRRRELMGMQGRLKTVSGSIVTVNDALARNAKSLVVNFAPVQASGTPSPDNVLPISGWTGVTGYRMGKNLFDEAKRTSSVNNIRYYYGTGENILLQPGTYTMACSEQVQGLYVNGTSATKYNSTFLTFTLTEAKEVNFNYYKEGINQNLVCWLVVGADKGEYSEYTGTTYPVDWMDTAGTVYGGYVDLVSGVLVAEWENKVLDGTENWVLYYNASEGTSFNTWISGKAGAYQTSISDSFSNVTGAWTSAYINSTGIYSDYYPNAIYCRPPIAGISTVDAFKAWLSENPVNLVYQLATPITYQLTPQTIAMLKGTNNVWANANGNVELTYYAQ